jgi:hypothetical protein
VEKIKDLRDGSDDVVCGAAVSEARAAGPDAAAQQQGVSSAPLDLITPTSYDRPARVYRYPSGAVEAVFTHTNGKTVGAVFRLGKERSDEARGTRDREVASRAASQFRRAAMAADMRYLLTCTYRENLTDYPTSKSHVQALMRSLRADYSGLRYVGAPELQKRGAWHWHVLTDVRLDAREVRAHWRHIVGSDNGNIDLVYWDDALKGARYAAKYVKKGFGELRVPGARYLRSRNIEVQSESRTRDETFELLAAAGWSGQVVPLETGGSWAASWA